MNEEGKKLGLTETDVLMVAHTLVNGAFGDWIEMGNSDKFDIGYLNGVNDLAHALLKELGEIEE